jgi:dsRNA-specific ribonuclease
MDITERLALNGQNSEEFAIKTGCIIGNYNGGFEMYDDESIVKATTRAFLVNAGAVAGVLAAFAGAVWAVSKSEKAEKVIKKLDNTEE